MSNAALYIFAFSVGGCVGFLWARVQILSRLLDSLRSNSGGITNHDLQEMENRIMAKQAEVTAGLVALQLQLVKANGEIQKKLADLETVIGNQDEASPELLAAFEALKPAAQALDDTSFRMRQPKHRHPNQHQPPNGKSSGDSRKPDTRLGRGRDCEKLIPVTEVTEGNK